MYLVSLQPCSYLISRQLRFAVFFYGTVNSLHTSKTCWTFRVVRRYDNKVKPNTITYCNNLLHQLCIDHKIAYINNDCIEKRILNISNLDLNKSLRKCLLCFFKTKAYLNFTYCSSLRKSFFIERIWSSNETVL